MAAILELNDKLLPNFIIFEAAPHDLRTGPTKKPQPEYFLWLPLTVFVSYFLKRSMRSDEILSIPCGIIVMNSAVMVYGWFEAVSELSVGQILVCF